MPEVTVKELEKYNAEIEKTLMRRKARRDLVWFSEQFAFGAKNPAHIVKWYNELMNPPENFVLRLAPRRHAKSTVHSIVYPIWEIIRNPNVRILICSSSASQAQAFLRRIRLLLTTNQFIKKYFSDIIPENPDLWTKSEILLNRTSTEQDPTVSTSGATGAVVSRRADIIICDDIVDSENSSTTLTRKQLSDWFWQTLLPILEPGGKLIVCGTRWDYFDLYGQLLTNTDFYHTIDKAIIDEDKKIVLWPEVMSYEKLIKRRENQGTLIFNMAYQNDVYHMQDALFKMEDIKYYELENDEVVSDRGRVKLKNLHIYMGIDPAISQADRGSYFGAVTVGIDDVQRVYVLDTIRARISLEEQVNKLVMNLLKWKPEVESFDSNAYQDSLRQIIEKKKDELRLPIKIKRVYTFKDKYRRFLDLARLVEQHKVYLLKSQHELLEEMITYPKGKTNDLLDALHLSIEAPKQRVASGFELI